MAKTTRAIEANLLGNLICLGIIFLGINQLKTPEPTQKFAAPRDDLNGDHGINFVGSLLVYEAMLILSFDLIRFRRDAE